MARRGIRGPGRRGSGSPRGWSWGRLVLPAILLLPLVEIAGFVWIGPLLGVWGTLLWTLMAALIGLRLLSRESVGALRRAEQALRDGAQPGRRRRRRRSGRAGRHPPRHPRFRDRHRRPRARPAPGAAVDRGQGDGPVRPRAGGVPPGPAWSSSRRASTRTSRARRHRARMPRMRWRTPWSMRRQPGRRAARRASAGLLPLLVTYARLR